MSHSCPRKRPRTGWIAAPHGPRGTPARGPTACGAVLADPRRHQPIGLAPAATHDRGSHHRSRRPGPAPGRPPAIGHEHVDITTSGTPSDPQNVVSHPHEISALATVASTEARRSSPNVVSAGCGGGAGNGSIRAHHRGPAALVWSGTPMRLPTARAHGVRGPCRSCRRRHLGGHSATARALAPSVVVTDSSSGMSRVYSATRSAAERDAPRR